MGQGGPVNTGGTPTATIGVNFSQLRQMPNVARETGKAAARELQNAFKLVQNEHKLVLAQMQQTGAAAKAQQTQMSATVRAESSVRIAAARAEATAKEQLARRETIAFSEAEKRKTATYRAEIRERERAARASQVGAASRGQGLMSFAGAAVGGLGGGAVGALAGGALPVAAGLAVSQGVRAAIDADAIATAYGRQTIASLELAGSQGRLNALLEAYGDATGGAVDKATTLSNVTNLQSIGFGKSAEQLERFTRAARGVSLARGKPQDEMIQEISLAIANQSIRRLDQIGLGVKEVNDRIAELRANNRGMTREAAFEEAVLSKLIQKYGALTTSVEGQATGAENASRAFKDARLEFGQLAGGAVNLVGNAMADFFDEQIRRTRQWRLEIELVGRALGLIAPGQPAFNDPRSKSSIGQVQPQRIYAGVVGLNEDQQALINQRYATELAITRNATQAINDATRQGAEQRVSIIASYEKGIAREQEDFGRQRANAEAKHGMAILKVAEDSARQRVKWEQDLARNIATAQSDSAERVADARKDSAKRLADLDKDFAKDQARREEDFNDDQLSAAGRLNAVALLELRKDRSRQLKDAEDSHKEQRADLQEQLQERIRDESETLEKSIRQQREAHQRQLDEQAANDALRIQEMIAAFAEQKAQEDLERGIRLERQATDHGQQLAEFDREQGERIAQIKRNAALERAQLDEEFEKQMDALGIRTKAYEEKVAAQEKAAIAAFDRWWKHLNEVMGLEAPGIPATRSSPRGFATGGLVERSGFAMVHRGEFVMPAPPMAPAASGFGNSTSNNNSRSITVHEGAFTIYAAPGQSEEAIAAAVIRLLDGV